MKNRISAMLVILFFSFAIVGCESKNNIKKINAESYTISYGKNIFKMEEEGVESLVKSYNNIKLNGETNLSIDYNKAITIIFIQNDQISGHITVDNKGVCRVEDKVNNYIITDESNIYEDALNVYHDLKI